MRTWVFGVVIALSLFICGCSGDAGTADVPPVQEQATPEETPVPQFTDANLALAEGIDLLENGETDKAIEVLNQAVTLNPDLAEAYFRLGIAYALVEARDQSLEVVEATPTPPTRGRRAAEVKSNSEKAFEKAVAAYKKMIAANEEDHIAHFNLGRSYNKLNEDEDAAKALKEAVKLNPEDTEYQTELGAILIKLAQYQEAIPHLKKALELDPANSKAEELLADAEAGRRRVDFATKKKEEQTPERPGRAANTNAAPTTTPPAANSRPANVQSQKPKPAPSKPGN